MKTHLPASKWSQTFNFTEQEFNDCLEELGLQKRITSGGSTHFSVTSRGARHSRMSRNPFKRVPLWDFDAFFQAVKLKGKKSGEYYYCDKCGDYMSDQHGFEFSMKKWVCKKCGYVNELGYKSPADRLEEPASGEVRTATGISQKCPTCGRSAEGIGELQAMFGFRKDDEGHISVKEVCKNCSGKVDKYGFLN